MMNITWSSPERLARPPVSAPVRVHRPDAAPPVELLGIEPWHYHDMIEVPGATTIELASVVTPRIATTWSLEEFKNWVGVPDAYIDPSTTPVDVAQMPEGPWSGRRVRTLEDLSPKERGEVEKAANLYVFSYSPWAESYRQVIETCHAPFRAQIYPIRSVRIASGARLVVEGEPSVLLIDDMVLEGGGQLALYTACRLWVGRLTKLA